MVGYIVYQKKLHTYVPIIIIMICFNYSGKYWDWNEKLKKFIKLSLLSISIPLINFLEHSL